MIKFFAPILIAISLILAAFLLGEDYGTKREKVECQKTEIVTKNIEIKVEKKKVKIKTYQNEMGQKDSNTIERKRWIKLFEQERVNSNTQ